MSQAESGYLRKHEWELFINAAVLLILAAAAVILYANTFEAPFLFDDKYSILDERAAIHIEDLSLESLKKVVTKSHAKRRPLAIISFAINYYVHKFDVFGYHLVNLVIHILTAFFLFFLFQTTLRLQAYNREQAAGPKDTSAATVSALEPTWIAFLAVLIWMLHPVQTNAVTYIVQRMTSLAAMSYILSILLYAKGRLAVRAGRSIPAAAFFTGCLVSALCAFASKEISATLPVFIILYEWFFFQDLRAVKIRWFLVGGLFLALFIGGAGYLLLGKNAIGRILGACGIFEFTLPQRVLTELRILAHYLGLIFFPHPSRLNLDYDYPISYSFIDPSTTLISAIMVMMLFIGPLFLAKRHRLFGFCALWFLGNLVIESSIICIELIYEHRVYLPSTMVILLAVSFAFSSTRHKRALTAVILAIACVLCVWTYQRNQVWASSEVAFWQDCALKSPHKARPYQHLGASMLRGGDYRQAVWYFKKSLQFKINTAALFKLGFGYGKLGWHLEAIDAYERAIKFGYRNPAVFSSMGREQVLTGDYEAALKSFKRAVKIDPNFNEASYNRQKLLEFLDDCHTQVECVEKLSSAYPKNPALRFKLGMLYEEKNELDKAVSYYHKALSMMRETDRRLYHRTLIRLADTHMKKGEIGGATNLLDKLAGLNLSDPDISYQLAALYAQAGNPEKALEWLEAAFSRGFRDARRLSSDSRFDALRGKDRFMKIQHQIATGKKNRHQSS